MMEHSNQPLGMLDGAKLGAVGGLALSFLIGLCQWLSERPFEEVMPFVGELAVLLVPTVATTGALIAGLLAQRAKVAPPVEEPSGEPEEEERYYGPPPTTEEMAATLVTPVIATSWEALWDRIKKCAGVQLHVWYNHQKQPSRDYMTDRWDYSQAEWNAARGILKLIGIVNGTTWEPGDANTMARYLDMVELEVLPNNKARLMVTALGGQQFHYVNLLATPENGSYLAS